MARLMAEGAAKVNVRTRPSAPQDRRLSSRHERRDGGSRNARTWLHCATGGRGERGGSGAFRTGPGSLLDAIPPARRARPCDGGGVRHGRPPDLQPRDDRRLPRQASGLRRPLRADGGHRLCGGLRHRGRALRPRRRVPDDSRRLPVRLALRRRGRVGFGDARRDAASSSSPAPRSAISSPARPARGCRSSPTDSARTRSPIFSSCASCPSCRSG